jgi:hypothetical protein
MNNFPPSTDLTIKQHSLLFSSRYTAVSVATGLRVEKSGFGSQKIQKFSLFVNTQTGCVAGRNCYSGSNEIKAESVRRIAHPCLVPRLMSAVIYLLHHTSSWHGKEQIYLYSYDGGSSVNVVGNNLIHGISFRNLIIDCMIGHFEELKILG